MKADKLAAIRAQGTARALYTRAQFAYACAWVDTCRAQEQAATASAKARRMLGVVDDEPPSQRNSYSTKEIRSLIGWRFEYTCNVCQTMFKSAHAAAFHTCDKVQRCAECRTGVLWHGVCPTCSPGLTQYGKDYERQLEEDEKARERQTVTREFTNELGNAIRITIEGPTSTSENILTPREVSELHSALELRVAAIESGRIPSKSKPSDWYDPAAQRDARPKKTPTNTPLTLLKLWERRLAQPALSPLAHGATLSELQTEIERRER